FAMAGCERYSVRVLRRFNFYLFFRVSFCVYEVPGIPHPKHIPKRTEVFLLPELRCVSIHPFRLCVLEIPEKYSIALSSRSPIGQQRRLEPNLIIATLIKTRCLLRRKLSHSPFPWILTFVKPTTANNSYVM
ncbi:mCG145923, partial [Mus musculus]